MPSRKKAKPRKKAMQTPSHGSAAKLWAPWRLEYILDPKVGPLKKHENCVFCNRRETSGDEEDRHSLILSRGKTCYTILNKFPYANGHLMVIPYEHINRFPDLNVEATQEMFLETQRATRILETVLQAQGFNIGMNLGRLAGAGIPDHIHIHVVPRWQGDNNFMPVIADTRVLPEYIETTYDRLVGAFRS